MGYRVQTQCLPDTNSALLEFQSLYPLHDGANVFYLSASSINATGLITFSEKDQLGTTTISAKTLQLTACDEIAHLTTAVDHMSMQSAFAVFLVVICFALGTVAGASA